MMAKTGNRSSMTRRRSTLALSTLSLVLTIGTAGAQEPKPLVWKFKPGEALRYRMDQSTKTQVKAGGRDNTVTVSQVLDTTWSVKSVEPTGAAVMVQRFDAVSTKLESPFGKVEYDSKSGKEPTGALAAGMLSILKSLVGQSFEYRMTPEGEVHDVKVPEALLKSLKESGPTGPAAGPFSEESLKTMISEMALPLSGKSGSSSWTKESKAPSPFGVIRTVKTFSRAAQKTSEGYDRLDMKVNMAFDPSPDSKVTMKISEQKGEGEVVFDNEKGRVVSTRFEEHTQVDLSYMDMSETQITDKKSSSTLLPPEKPGTN
jgi:hypothetical protein